MYGTFSRQTDQEQGFRPRNVDNRDYPETSHTGRFPANLIHDGSPEVMELFPDTRISTGDRTIKRSGGGNGGSGKLSEKEWSNDDPGSAARFFYCAKAHKNDRDEGLDGFEAIISSVGDQGQNNDPRRIEAGKPPTIQRGNHHPTVKPTPLMTYLCRLITPPKGTVLDPYMGSGSTGKAAVKEGFNFIGIEIDAIYFKIATQRIKNSSLKGAIPPPRPKENIPPKHPPKDLMDFFYDEEE